MPHFGALEQYPTTIVSELSKKLNKYKYKKYTTSTTKQFLLSILSCDLSFSELWLVVTWKKEQLAKCKHGGHTIQLSSNLYKGWLLAQLSSFSRCKHKGYLQPWSTEWRHHQRLWEINVCFWVNKKCIYICIYVNNDVSFVWNDMLSKVKFARHFPNCWHGKSKRFTLTALAIPIQVVGKGVCVLNSHSSIGCIGMSN